MASTSSNTTGEEATGDKRKMAYAHMAALATHELVTALRQDMYPSDEFETVFGIQGDDGLGQLIYKAWSEIYSHHLFVAGEVLLGEEGPASGQFQREVGVALTQGRLATCFRQWMDRVIQDDRFPKGVYCRQLKSQSLPLEHVIHPTSTEHKQWMDRFRIELGGDVEANAKIIEPLLAGSPAAATASTPAPVAATSVDLSKGGFCHFCGAYGATKRCLACKEVYYCSKEHQKQGWKRHKLCCKNIGDVSVWIHVLEGDGNGLGNERTNHIFKTKAEGLDFVQRQWGGSLVIPLRSPFCELAGWDVEIYCNPQINDIDLSTGRVNGKSQLNSAGVYLGCDLGSGLTKYNNMSGHIFVTGRRQRDGKPLNKEILWGLLAFIWDSMDLYDGTSHLPLTETLQKWAAKYQQGTWVPNGGTGGVDIYSNDYAKGAVDHR